MMKWRKEGRRAAAVKRSSRRLHFREAVLGNTLHTMSLSSLDAEAPRQRVDQVPLVGGKIEPPSLAARPCPPQAHAAHGRPLLALL